MTIEGTVRALAELSEIDQRLSGAGEGKDRVYTLEGRRWALREAIPGNYLAAYDDLGRAGRRPAVVPLVHGAHCGGCHMRVPPQLGVFVRRSQSVCSCPHCRRLLYFAAPAAESERGNGPERHAAGTPVRGRRTSSRAPVGKKKRPA
jgi:predicted  nucleic acid-binding Zn-ribbon protein